MEHESPRLRLGILAIVVMSLFGALFARLWYLQVMAAPAFQVEAQANRVRTVAEEAPRGRILDAQGRVLVANRSSLVVTVNPHDLEEADDPADVTRRLAQALTDFGVPTKVSTIERRLGDKQYNPLQPVPVAIDVPEELFVYLSEREREFPSVAVRRESVRAYPHGTTAAHVLGYVGRVSQEELEAKQGTGAEPTIPKPYQPDSNIGKSGIERAFEDDLRGTPGLRTVEVDAQGRVVRTIEEQAPRPGNDVQLTIDLDAQQRAELALAEQLDSLRGGRTRDGKLRKAPAGSVVVLDPTDGSVVAMASAPTYDPAEFVNGISQRRFEELQGGVESENPLINRSIQGLYAPGSTFKPITAYAAIAKGLIDGNTYYNDRGSYDMGDFVRYNAGRVAHGSVNVPRSLTVSSDVYYYWLGDQFWDRQDEYGDAIQDTARAFGFGSPSGVTLGAERAGVVPDAAYKRQLWESLPPEEQRRGDPTWYPGDNVNLAIGQGYALVTPLQLANAYATLANGGTLYQPNLVWRVLVPGGDPADPASVVRVVEPVVRGQVPMPPELADPIIDGLASVASDPKGTAVAPFRGFDQKAFPLVSKTGTAEVDGKADNSLFVAYGPRDAPRYVAVAILEESGFGAEAAAPVVRRVLELLSGQELSSVGDIATEARD